MLSLRPTPKFPIPTSPCILPHSSLPAASPPSTPSVASRFDLGWLTRVAGGEQCTSEPRRAGLISGRRVSPSAPLSDRLPSARLPPELAT